MCVLFTVNIYINISFLFTAHGCSAAHNSITLGDWRDPFDPDVDAQVIFSQFWLGKEQIKILADSKGKDKSSIKKDDGVFISPTRNTSDVNGVAGTSTRNTEYEVISNGYIPSVYVKGYTERHTDVSDSTVYVSEADVYQQLLTVIQQLEDEHLRASAPSTPTDIMNI